MCQPEVAIDRLSNHGKGPHSFVLTGRIEAHSGHIGMELEPRTGTLVGPLPYGAHQAQ